MLGLGLLGAHPLGDRGLRWLMVDLVWAVVAGLAIGAALGTLVGRLVLYLRRDHRQAVDSDDCLALGLIGMSCGTALLATSYGFPAVFAAGVALRRVERQDSRAHGRAADAPLPAPEALIEHALTNPSPPVAADHIATHPVHAPAFMAIAMLGYNEPARTLVALVLTAVVASIVVHGASVIPLMAGYDRLVRRRADSA